MPVRKIVENAKQSRSVGRQERTPLADTPRAVRDAAAAAEWSVASAKAKFSEVVASAATSPQTIKRNGKAVAVVVGIDEWTRKTARKGTLSEFFQSAPEGFADLDFSRSKDVARDIKL